MPPLYFIGVDVGTGSCRAAICDSKGDVKKIHVKEIKTFNPLPDHYEQSSDNIWSAVCECVRAVSRNFCKEEIVGIGFDATCSLVALDTNFEPLTVSSTGNDDQNIVLWMDHRAGAEAEAINATGHQLLQHVGGKISLEMECPKLVWLKKNLFVSCWSKVGAFFDLPDYLTWKCTGSATRSICSVGCKWNFDAINGSWSTDFLEKIGLADLADNKFGKIGSTINFPADPIGHGLSEQAAIELNLLPNTAVGTSMIDAHAGALALLGCGSHSEADFTTKLAIICGTSSCHMSVTRDPLWVPGVWGPYKHALLPNMYLSEAGQSATGVLLDYVLRSHPSYPELREKLGPHDHLIYGYLNNVIEMMAEKRQLTSFHQLTERVHVWPDFHGNRSPIADPNLKGMICGLTITKDESNLAVLYLAVVQSLAYATKQIVEALVAAGRSEFSSILLCGGLCKNSLFVQTHADICGIRVYLPEESEAVLLGAAILGAYAARVYPDLHTAALSMGGKAKVIEPAKNPAVEDYHRKKYKVFLKMLADQRSYDEIMTS